MTTEMKLMFHVAVPSLQMRGGLEDTLDLRQSTSVTNPHKARAWEGSGALSWWTVNDVQSASAEMKWSTELRNWATVLLIVVMLGSGHYAIYAGSVFLSPQTGLQHKMRDSSYMAGTPELGHEPGLPDPAGFDNPCPLSPSLQGYWYVWCPQQGWRVRLKYK